MAGNHNYIRVIDAKRELIALPADLDAETVQRCIEAMNRVPAADVALVYHGWWILDEGPDNQNRVNGDRLFRCSICGYADEHNLSVEVPYCWHCGARMRMRGGTE